ncbi:hypothetical protein H6G97_28825 [Nostoc flagelliforme FACHB-838]|uniref:Class IIb bacteriocin, lactobin A/cerein 7B family n=1 Tax=Nostoc flagelliforme FACHB-838 TaxID=2692904 RepID=A0ABR8DVK1_9NOSO|nr:hypothetical protein [Nostoc flagelliforme]MBD2533350.1 hypothetical protein [Nostoc flagelliforme FACHB-838]
MTRIQITDLNPSEPGLLYELTDEELLDINGGSLFGRIVGAVVTVVGIGVSIVNPPLGTGLILGGSAIYELNRDE